MTGLGSLIGGGGGQGPVESLPCRILSFYFTANGVLSWTFDADYDVLGFYGGTGVVQTCVGPVSPVIPTTDGVVIGRFQALSHGTVQQSAAMRIPYKKDEKIYVRNASGSACSVDVIIQHVLRSTDVL